MLICGVGTKFGQFCEVDKLSSYYSAGDAAYLSRPRMLVPFISHKDGLSHDEYHWNFVQSSIRMCVERSFGILKGDGEFC